MQCRQQRLFGAHLVIEAMDKIGARNLKLVSDGVAVNVITVTTQLQGAKALLESGALKTTIYVLNSIIAGMPAYADIFTEVKHKIEVFLTETGY